MSRPHFDFERYVNIRSAYSPIWLAGGRVAFLTDITGTPQVWTVDEAGSWPEQLTFFQEKVWALSPSPSGSQLICSRDIGGNERHQLFLVSADGAEVRRLTEDDGAIHHFGGWSHDGRRIAFASNGRNGSDFDIFVLTLADGSSEMVYQGQGNLRVACWSADDSRLLLTDEISSAQQQLQLLNLTDGRLRQLAGGSSPANYMQPRWPVGENIYLLTNQGRDKLCLSRLDAASGQLSVLTDLDYDIDSLAVSADGRQAALCANVDGYSRLMLHQLASGETTAVAGLPDGVIGGLTFSPDGRRLAVNRQSPTDNLNVWQLDLEKPAAHQISRSSLAGIPRSTLVAPELIKYPTFDGLDIPAFFYRPPGVEAPYPVILYVHGGPASQILPDFDPRFQYFLNQGYAILAPNVRGSSGYGKAYMALDDVELRMDSVTDLKHAVAWLHRSGEADPARIGIYGRSYGGFMVLAAVTRYPDLWAAAINVVGIGNWVTFLEKTSSWRRSHREKEYGSLAQDRAFLASISPIHQADRIQAPMLVIHGANDPRVPVAEADQLVASLKERNHPVEYLCYPDEGHKISKLTNRIDSFTKMADFLGRFL